MHPAAFVVGVGRVMAVACAGSLMHDDRGKIVNTGRVGSTRFRAAIKNKLRQVERIYREIDAQIDFSPENLTIFYVFSRNFSVFTTHLV